VNQKGFCFIGVGFAQTAINSGITGLFWWTSLALNFWRSTNLPRHLRQNKQK
jgi:hypothetical protein